MTFRPNHNFLDELEAQAEPRAELAVAARSVATRVEAHDIMPRKGVPSQIEVVTDGDEVAVANHAYGAHIDEWGSVNSPPYAPLRNAVRTSGLRLVEHGK